MTYQRKTTVQTITERLGILRSLSHQTEYLLNKLERSGIDLSQWSTEVANIRQLLAEYQAVRDMLNSDEDGNPLP